MAADNSPARIQVILITAFMAVLTLVGLKFVFDSYYITMFEAEEYRKVGSVVPTELLALRAAEKKSLAAAPVPIDRAMDLVVKGRGEPMQGKAGDITPQPSTDNAPIIGWAALAKAAPSAGPASSAAPAGAAPAASASSAPSAVPAASASAAAPAAASASGAAAPRGASSSAPASTKAPAPAPSTAPSAHP